MVACAEWTLVKYEGRAFTGIPLRCHRWDCPGCAPRQRRRFLRALRQTHVDALLTLTCHPKRFRDPATAFRHMSRQVPNLVKRLRRWAPGCDLQYVVVWEQTKRGWPHAHLLLRGPYLPQRLISSMWRTLAFSPIIDIRHVAQQPEAHAYVAKYLAKQPRVPPGYRRFRSSQAFWQSGSPTRRSARAGPSLWSLHRNPLSFFASLWEFLGFDVSVEPAYTVTAVRPRPPPVYDFKAAAGQTIPLWERQQRRPAGNYHRSGLALRPARADGVRR